MQSNNSEESKRRNLSIRSNISKDDTNHYNNLLKLLDKVDENNQDKVIQSLKSNKLSLKTALMWPIGVFIEKLSDPVITPEVYLKYTDEDEIYGLSLVIRNKNLKWFKYLWQESGPLFWEKHLLSVIKEMVINRWELGIKELLGSEHTHEMFVSMYCNERKTFYEQLWTIAEDLQGDSSEESKTILATMMKGLAIKPYATMTFLYMFRYIHKTQTRIRTHEIDPPSNTDDLFVIMYKKGSLYEMAENFADIWGNDLEQKQKYQNILMKLIDFSFVVMPNAIPISRIWKSIKMNKEADFKKCLQESRKNWSLLITLRKSPLTEEFKQPIGDERVRSLGIPKWKPAHLMIYFERISLLSQIIEFSGNSLRKALTIDNKKTHASDDFHGLKMCIRIKSEKTFRWLWKINEVWSVLHVYLILKELNIPDFYHEEIFKTFLTSPTTKDIISFCHESIKEHLFEMMYALATTSRVLKKDIDSLKEKTQSIKVFDRSNSDNGGKTDSSKTNQ